VTDRNSNTGGGPELAQLTYSTDVDLLKKFMLDMAQQRSVELINCSENIGVTVATGTDFEQSLSVSLG